MIQIEAKHQEAENEGRRNKGHKPNKIWVDKGSEFYNNSFKKWLKNNDIEMYSTHNEENKLLLKDLLEH